MTRLHLIANSHLDPVWLWDWREGLNEAITTCRTILALMEEFPELTYIRGEAVTYEHIARHDPVTFARIREQIAGGRWDVVGGSFLQPDTNLPATETLVRQYTRGLGYFQRELGCRPTVAWSADSFGHSAGWPAIFAAAGMDAFAFSRPFERELTLEKPGFWWESGAGRRVLAWRMPLGWYGTERDEMTRRLDEYRKFAPYWGVQNVAVFYGLGNHGGGPSRRQLREIRRWRESNLDVEVIHSGLHRFFAELRAETAAVELPVVRGELNFTLRGCYASASRFKATYRRTENRLAAAEKTQGIIAAAGIAAPPADLTQAWEAVLFNTFHDILPGTSIERAFDDQFAWLGVAHHDAQRAELAALNALAAEVDTSVEIPADDMPCAVPVLVWNPHPWAVQTPVEIEAGLDYRPVSQYLNRPEQLPVEVLGPGGEPLAFQRAAVENLFCPTLAWRVRVIVPLQLPPMGWQVVRLSWNETPRLAASAADGAARADGAGSIAGGVCRVAARVGETGVHVFRDGEAIFGDAGLTAATMDDPWGAWGGHDNEPGSESIDALREVWRIVRVETLETGPERAALWVRLEAGGSRLELTFRLARGTAAVEIVGRLIWNERAARLKLCLPNVGSCEYEVPGGAIRRADLGEVPGGRWVRSARFAFVSDAIYNFDTKDDVLRATVVRSCRYTASHAQEPEDSPFRPYMDLGEHRFRALVAAPGADLPRLADEFEQPPAVLAVPPGRGDRAEQGSFAELLCADVRLLACKPARDGDGFIVRLQAAGAGADEVKLRWMEANLELGALGAWEIGSWRLRGHGMHWEALRVLADENG